MLGDLAWCGPNQPTPKIGLDQAFRYCERLAETHYENFSVTNWWLPRELRPHFASIYAYCRWSDDLADEMASPELATELLAWWRSELHDCFRGKASHPVFVALRQTIDIFAIPPEPFEDLLSAFLQDQTKTRYEDDGILFDYCRRSANPVGRLVLALAKSTSKESSSWSDSICTGLQLANFCQDVAVDAKRGRIYLPHSRLVAAGVTEEEWTQGLGRSKLVLAGWLELARERLNCGLPLAQVGPGWFRRSIRLFVGGGLRILGNIEQAECDVWNRAIEVTKWQKLSLLWKSIFQPLDKPNKQGLTLSPSKQVHCNG